jgi:hypothetical protein
MNGRHDAADGLRIAIRYQPLVAARLMMAFGL